MTHPGWKKPWRPVKNPIVWSRDRWRWMARHVPHCLSPYEWENGSVERRRINPPGTVLERFYLQKYRARWR